jgi:hypothetical protein
MLKTNLFLSRRSTEGHAGFNVVLIITPTEGNIYRQEVALRVGEDEDIETVALAIATCARRIAMYADFNTRHPVTKMEED